MDMHSFLLAFWIGVAGLSLLLYVVLDGFDLGVGILSLVACDDDRHGLMKPSLSRVWHAMETQLVLLGGVPFGAFPPASPASPPALYFIAVVILYQLIIRGASF